MGIKKLSDEIINRIAAGEVIEKPAFVIKELVENAIDANATEIEVIIKDGGKRQIIVSDNGLGISKNDLSISIQRHATSKLDENDLNKIEYLGFRGEALPSIASVSDLTIDSYKKNQSSGWKININYNTFVELSPSSRIFGTKVSVKNLFKTTPARLKFLKNNIAENLHSQSIVKNWL